MGGRFAFNRRLGAAFCRPGSEDGGRVSLGNSGVLYTGIKRAAQVLRSLGYRSGSPDGLHKGGYVGSIAYDADGVKISGEKFTSVIGPLQKKDRATGKSRLVPPFPTGGLVLRMLCQRKNSTNRGECQAEIAKQIAKYPEVKAASLVDKRENNTPIYKSREYNTLANAVNIGLQDSARATAASRAAPAGSGPSHGRCVPDRRIHTFCGKRHSRPPACSGPAPMGCRPR